MTLHDIRERVAEPGKLPRAVYALIIIGLMIEMTALIIGVALGASIGDYFANSKAVRDAAAAGSGTLSQIGTISAVEAWLEPLKVLGAAIFFLAIALALRAIVGALQTRGAAMRVALPLIAAARKSGQN